MMAQTSKSNGTSIVSVLLVSFTLFNFEGLLDLQGWTHLEAQTSYGGVAQLGEHLPCKQGVDSSILFVSTTGLADWKRAGHRHGLIAQVVRAHA